MSNWNQPCCDECWALRSDREPVRVLLEQCAFCGERTNSGIYVRADPQSVPFPREVEQPAGEPAERQDV